MLFVEQAEQVIEEDNMLEALDVIELYCKILIEQAAQLEKPKYVQSLSPSKSLLLASRFDSPFPRFPRSQTERLPLWFVRRNPGNAARRSRRRRRG